MFRDNIVFISTFRDNTYEIEIETITTYTSTLLFFLGNYTPGKSLVIHTDMYISYSSFNM